MILGYSEFEGFDRRKNNIMGPIEHFYFGAPAGGAEAEAGAPAGGAEGGAAGGAEAGALAAAALAAALKPEGVTITYKKNKDALDRAYNEYTTDVDAIQTAANDIIEHIEQIRTETKTLSGDTQTAFNKIDGIITDVDTTEKNEDILNKRTTFDKKYNNIKELNNKNKKIVTILLVVNIVIMTILLFGSYLVLSDKGNPFGKSKVSNNKNGYNNLSSL